MPVLSSVYADEVSNAPLISGVQLQPQYIAPSSKLKDTLNIREFGAVGNGITDDSHAIDAALKAAVAAKRASIYIPDGEFLLGNPVFAKFGKDISITIYGNSAATSRILVANDQGGIILKSTSRQSPVILRDFGIVTNKKNGGTAFQYTVPPGGTSPKRIFEARNLHIGPQDQTKGYDQSFNRGLVSTGMYRPYINNVYVTQSVDATHKMDVGININETWSPHVEDNYVKALASIGISHKSEIMKPEGLFLINNIIVGPDIGFHHYNKSSREPHFIIENNHFNCVISGIILDGVKYGWVSKNLMYARKGAVAGYIDFNVYNAEGIEFRSNIYRGSGKTRNRIHINLEKSDSGTIRDIYIDDFGYQASADTGVKVGKNVERVFIRQPKHISREKHVSYKKLVVTSPAAREVYLLSDQYIPEN
jgi:hypothetical protein